MAPRRYLDQTLSPGEKVVYRGRVHWAILFPPYFMGAVGGVCAVVLYQWSENDLLATLFAGALVLTGGGAIWGTQTLLHALGMEVIVTNQRLAAKVGVFSRETEEMPLARVESVTVYQSIPGRIVNYGDVTVTGIGSVTISCDGIADPTGLRAQLQSISSTQRQ